MKSTDESGKSQKGSAATQVVVALLCLLVGAVGGIVAVVNFLPRQSPASVPAPATFADNRTNSASSIAQITAARFQLVPCTVERVGLSSIRTEQTVFKIDTQTGQAWMYFGVARSAEGYWYGVTNLEDWPGGATK